MKFRFVTKSLTALVILLILSFVSCSDSVTPEDKPGSRDYVWEVDTIGVQGQNISLMRFVGFDESNVWASGLASSGYEIWHFNGSEWENKSFGKGYNVYTIYGSDPNSIWIYSGNKETYKLVNEQWIKTQDIEVENSTHIVLQDMAGSTASNLYAFGSVDYPGINNYKGVLFHFNGTSWQLKKLIDEKVSFKSMIWDEQNDEYKFLGIHWNEYGGSYKNLYSYKETEIDRIHQGINDGNIQLEYMGKVGEQIWYGYKNTISKFSNGEFIPVITLSDAVLSGGSIKGRHSGDVFFTNSNAVFHYNGTDVNKILEIEGNYHIYGIELFEKSVFVFCVKKETTDSYVYRGYLK